MSDVEKLARRREQYREKRVDALADEYFQRLQHGGNRLVCDDYGSFSRWTWADRSGEWLDAEGCAALIASERVHKLREYREDGALTQVFGDRP